MGLGRGLGDEGRWLKREYQSPLRFLPPFFRSACSFE